MASREETRLTGQICVTGSNPCQQISASNGGSVDYLAPAGVPSPNPVTVTATSQADSSQERFGERDDPAAYRRQRIAGKRHDGERRPAAIRGHGNGHGQSAGDVDDCGQRDAAIQGRAGPSIPPGCTLRRFAPSPEPDQHRGHQFGRHQPIGHGKRDHFRRPEYFVSRPIERICRIGRRLHACKYPGATSSHRVPGPAPRFWLRARRATTSCVSSAECTTSLHAADLQSAGNLAVQVQNPDGTLSNTATFVVLAPGSGAGTIPLTPSAPSRAGKDIVVVELSTNGGSGAAGNVSLNVAAIGTYTVATSSCTLGGSPVIILRPATGTATADLCVFSVSGLDPSYTYTISGPPVPDITISNREPLGLGIIHLTLQVPATAAAGPRTLFVENPDKDKAAGTGAIEVR